MALKEVMAYKEEMGFNYMHGNTTVCYLDNKLKSIALSKSL